MEPQSGSDGGRQSTRGPMVLGIVVSVAATLLAVGHMVWPDVRIDAITLGLLVVAVVPWLGRIFSSLEFPGGWKVTYRELERHVERQLTEKQEQVDQLAGRVQKVENLVFKGGTAQEQEAVGRPLAGFQTYMAGLGYTPQGPPPTIQIGPAPGEADTGAIGFYDGSRDLVFVATEYADDPDVALRTYCHHILQTLAPSLWAQENWAQTATATLVRGPSAVHSGLADYFPCSFRNDPCFGRGVAAALRAQGQMDGDCLRDMTSTKDVSSLGATTVPQYAGELWGAALWELRRTLGADRVDAAALTAWRTTPAGAATFAAAFVDRLADCLRADAATVREPFDRRGLAVGG